MVLPGVGVEPVIEPGQPRVEASSEGKFVGCGLACFASPLRSAHDVNIVLTEAHASAAIRAGGDMRHSRVSAMRTTGSA
jgi:hypothetical protein